MEQNVSGNSFRKFGQPPEVVLFSGNLEIPEISCSIWHFYPVRPGRNGVRLGIGPVPLVVKSCKMAASKSVESTLHWMQNDLPRLEPVLDRKRKR